jgi:4-amino-4-deoxy-L-arabinose transferase-like glycosyltransferase
LSATTSIPRQLPGTRPVPGGNRARRLLRGPEADPRWARPAFLGLLALTALLYLWNLTRNGWANDFYAAAVDAGTKSWKAFFFGSFDSSNFITVDKTPASLWVMEISGRIFGFNQWSALAPQALEGVASVAVLYAAIRRWFGPQAGLIAGLVLALTPSAALMFRFNNPDALLVLLMTVAAYLLVRALENGRTKWLVLCGIVLGFAFLAKMLQAFLVVPGFAVAYLWAGPPRLGKRIWQTVLLGVGIIVGAGWWVLAAELTPAADRPYFGGSTTNNILQLAIGYNGLGRLDGSETGSIGRGGNGQGASFGGSTGIFRLFQSEFGGQISWLLPAALISLAAMLWVTRRAVRTDRTRAAALLWGGWVLVTGLVFSYMSGIIHPYYMVALAPGIAALVGIGATALWQARLGLAGRITAAVAVLASAVWAYVLLNRTPDWLPWLRWGIMITGAAAAAAVIAGPYVARSAASRRGRLALVLVPVGLAVIASLAGPTAYALDTVNSTHTGAIPSAGPSGRFGGGPGGAGFPGGGRAGQFGRGTGTGGTNGGAGFGGFGGQRNGGFGGQGGTGAGSTGTGSAGTGSTGTGAPAVGGTPGRTGGFGGRGGGFGGGGLGGSTTVSSALVKLLEQDASSYKWVAATEGSEGAAPLELATGDAVMAIGGFNGTDPWPTLAAFEAAVAKHQIHYYVGQGSQSFGGGQGSSTIASWVAAHFKSETVGGETVYNLTQPTS